MVMFNFTNLTDMKKVFRIMGLCALVALAATSCKKEEQKLASSFKAELTQPTSDAKTHLSGSDLHWNSGDAIKVFDANGTAYMMSTTDNNVKEATFTSETTLDANESYTAFYPASGATKSGTEVLLGLPAVQTYAEGTFGNATYPMAATNTGTSFTFHSPCGLLAIPVKGTGNIGTIELTGKASENLAGQLRYNLNGEHQGLTNGQATVTLDCGNIALDATNATTFYFVVPAGVFANGFKAVLKNGTTELYTLETVQDNTIAAETIKLMPVVTVSVVAVTTDPIANVGYTDATVSGSYVAPTGMSVTEVGFYFGTDATALTTKEQATLATPFSHTFDGLTEGTTYYYMAYAKNGENEYVGSVESFTTNTSIVAPTVTTAAATAITTTTATEGGEVTDNGGATVTQYGICWSTNENPTTDDSKLYTDGEPTGAFTFNMTGLTHNTTYHVRAYAVNSAGTAYGSDVTFTTVTIVAPTVTTIASTNVETTTATVGGNITNNGGGSISAYGISYSTTDGFEGADGTQVTGSDLNEGAFVVNLTNLTSKTTYYARAFATNEAGTAYGNQVSFTTLQEGIVNSKAKFTINAAGDQVYFSKGNLQYTKSTGVWSFMEHQYDIVETTGQNVGTDYANQDVVSHFGWGTSGCNLRETTSNYYYQPYSTYYNSNSGSSYGYYGGRYYGPDSNTANLTGEFANGDWGVYNAMSNGGNAAGMWRTPSKDEWVYIIESRNGASSKYGHASINGVNGVILLPDAWELPDGLSFTSGSSNWANVYTIEQWELMETAGAVFLPAAGARLGTQMSTTYAVGKNGYYWSSTHADGYSYQGRHVTINPNQFYPQNHSARSEGFSVRLVCPVE